MANISASDVSKLRKQTGAGMMDCKKALTEAEGDFDKAVEIIRKRGQAMANKRADREATEGCVLAGTTADGKRGAMIMLNCETDFVAKNDDFVALAKSILDIAVDSKIGTLEELLAAELNGSKISDVLADNVAKIGEKLEVTSYEVVESEKVISYIHAGNRLATLVGFNNAAVTDEVAKDIAMQAAAMSPVGIDKEDVPADVIEKEKEIGREQARQEGKPEQMLDKIAEGKLNKFFKENTLLNQAFIKDNKLSVKQYLQASDKNNTVTAFKRVSLS